MNISSGQCLSPPQDQIAWNDEESQKETQDGNVVFLKERKFVEHTQSIYGLLIVTFRWVSYGMPDKVKEFPLFYPFAWYWFFWKFRFGSHA